MNRHRVRSLLWAGCLAAIGRRLRRKTRRMECHIHEKEGVMKRIMLLFVECSSRANAPDF